MCVGVCSRRSIVRTVVVYREAPSFSFPPLNEQLSSALTESVNRTCQQPIGGELLQTRTMDQSRVPRGGPKKARPERQEELLFPVCDLLYEE